MKGDASALLKTTLFALQVYDQASEEWVCVEENCEAGKEIVVFGGKALERVTGDAFTSMCSSHPKVASLYAKEMHSMSLHSLMWSMRQCSSACRRV